MKYMPLTGLRSRAAVSVIAAALILSSCTTAAPAVPPTVTPYGGTPTPASAVPTATANAEKTATAAARTGATADSRLLPPPEKHGSLHSDRRESRD